MPLRFVTDVLARYIKITFKLVSHTAICLLLCVQLLQNVDFEFRLGENYGNKAAECNVHSNVPASFCTLSLQSCSCRVGGRSKEHMKQTSHSIVRILWIADSAREIVWPITYAPICVPKRLIERLAHICLSAMPLCFAIFWRGNVRLFIDFARSNVLGRLQLLKRLICIMCWKKWCSQASLWWSYAAWNSFHYIW